MRILSTGGRPVSDPASVVYARCTVDLTAGVIAFTDIPCRNLEDVLGGFGRSFQILATRDITDAFSPANPLVVNTGALTGTSVMTGLRTYFSAYSPLKKSNKGLPAAIWSAARVRRIHRAFGRLLLAESKRRGREVLHNTGTNAATDSTTSSDN